MDSFLYPSDAINAGSPIRKLAVHHLLLETRRQYAGRMRHDRGGPGCRHDASLRVDYRYTKLQLAFSKVS